MSQPEVENSIQSNPFFEVVTPYCQTLESVDGSIEEPRQSDPEIVLAMVLTAIKAGHMAFGDGYQIDEEDIEHRFADDKQDVFTTGDTNDLELLKVIKRDAKSSPNPLQLVAAAFLAAEHMPPEGYDGKRIPTPSKGRETLDHRVYRTAMTFLRAYASDQHIDKGIRQKVFQITSDAGVVDSQGDIAPNTARQIADRFSEDPELHAASYLSIMAKDILQMLEQHSPQEVNDGISEVYASLVRRYKVGIEMDETGWTILPIEEWDNPTQAVPQVDTNPVNLKDKFVDWHRLERLKNYVREWRGAYLAVANLKSQGDEEYYVAVLPATLGHLAVEHAIGDNPSSGNAVYAWRAEKGIDADETAVTWRGVFKQTKRIARALGARRMLHTENLDSNLLDYMTRPADKLDVPNYDRA